LGMKWKKETHKNYRTTLVETFHYEMEEGILFINLKEKLEKLGISFNPLSEKEKLEIMEKSAEDEFKKTIELFATFITLLKSNNYSISEIIQKNNKQNLSFLKERNELFIEIIKPIFQLYENFLKRENELDFNDLINKATNYINQGMLKDVYKYIIIDEFQDISIGRYNLLK